MVKDGDDDLHQGRTTDGLVSLDQGRDGDHQDSNYFMSGGDSTMGNRVPVIEVDNNYGRRVDGGRGNRNLESFNRTTHVYNGITSEHGEPEYREINKITN